jgi:hypothetical protein
MITPERKQYGLFEFTPGEEVVRTDAAFLRALGIEPCLLYEPSPNPSSYLAQPRVRLTKWDQKWLKACGVRWEPEPTLQLSLEF